MKDAEQLLMKGLLNKADYWPDSIMIVQTSAHWGNKGSMKLKIMDVTVCQQSSSSISDRRTIFMFY